MHWLHWQNKFSEAILFVGYTQLHAQVIHLGYAIAEKETRNILQLKNITIIKSTDLPYNIFSYYKSLKRIQA
jgi:hypothetical protein